MSISVFFFSFLLALMSCAISSKHPANAQAEHVRVRTTSYHIANNEATAYLSFANNVWYKDSVGITQMTAIQSVGTPTTDTIFTATIGYRLVDMRKKWAYEYRNLSDTAAIMKKIVLTDSVLLIGGWNFFRPFDIIVYDSLRSVGDTTISGIRYARYRLRQLFGGNQYLSEELFRCDKKGSIFTFSKKLSDEIGCPLVKRTTLTPDGKFPVNSGEIEFVSNNFPDSIQRVFAAWKRNVQLYPVQ